MREINGYKFVGFNLDSLTLIADLIYYDGPLLSHYISEQGDNYLFYWIDSDEECNRWMIIRVNLSTIQDYVNQKLPLFDVIKNRADQSVYIADLDSDINVKGLYFADINDLYEDYFPKKESFYQSSPIDASYLDVLSKKYNQGIFEIKITGEGVQYGSIPMEKLSSIISNFEGVRKTLADDFIKRKKKLIKARKEQYKKEIQTKEIIGNIESLNAQERSLQLDTSYDTICSAAGSFRILFKSKDYQLNLWNQESIADEFARELVTCLSAGEKIDTLKEFTQKYSKGIVKKLENFITSINENKLNIDLKWYNDRIQASLDYRLPFKSTPIILENLATFEYNDVEPIEMTGKFYAIDLKAGRYSFEGEFSKSTGHFSKQIIDGVYKINFSKIYSVQIQRRIIQIIGRKEKIEDLLVGFIENTETTEP